MKINLWDILESGNIKDQFYDALTDLIGDKTGFMVNAYSLDDKINIVVHDLDLDKDEY